MRERQVVLDTETTGLDPAQGHRVIEIGCIELRNRRQTEQRFHVYLQPERAIDEGAIRVHGLTNEFLADQPRFAEIAEQFLEFVRGAELIIHNAPFDLGFLNHELQRCGAAKACWSSFARSRILCYWPASAIPASATIWTRYASATASTTRNAPCMVPCSTPKSWPTSIWR
jgi:hypothetical protein